MQRLENLFMNHYKKIIIIPILLLVLSLVVFGIQAQKGSIITKDISLQGGTSVTITSEQSFNINDLQESLEDAFPNSDILVRELADVTTGKKIGILIEATNLKNEELQPFLEKYLETKFTSENYSVEEIGASLSVSFFKELQLAMIFSFLFMSIVVFITFRKIVPSLTIILTALTDILVTLAVVSIMHLRISTAGIAAFLLLIGYSIDTDILLTTKVLKRTGPSLFARVYSSMKTGLTMTITAIAAVTVGLFSNSVVLQQIFTIILIGLIVDVISTYLGNAPALIWYCKKKNIQ